MNAKNGKPRIERVPVNLTVNDQPRMIMVEPRTTLLDALREDLGLTGTKKSCDRGECGACTVHIDGRRVLSCMTLTDDAGWKTHHHDRGLGARTASFARSRPRSSSMTASSAAFAPPGRSCRPIAVIEEAKAGWPSAATTDLREPFTLADLSKAEIRERMSGNLCRCACYPNIVDAVADAARRS